MGVAHGIAQVRTHHRPRSQRCPRHRGCSRWTEATTRRSRSRRPAGCFHPSARDRSDVPRLPTRPASSTASSTRSPASSAPASCPSESETRGLFASGRTRTATQTPVIPGLVPGIQRAAISLAETSPDGGCARAVDSSIPATSAGMTFGEVSPSPRGQTPRLGGDNEARPRARGV